MLPSTEENHLILMNSTKQNELVSIIVPVFNGEKFICKTIDSILKQTYSNFELIIIDDGSVDDTNRLIRLIQDPRILVVDQENSGVSASRNKGLRISNGAYVCFFDADDIMADSFISDRLNFLTANQEIQFCCSGYIDVDENDKQLRIGGFSELPAHGSEEILLFSSTACTTPSSFIFEAGFLTLNHLEFHTGLSNTADRLFILECCKKGKGGYFDGSPFYHLISQGSMSKTMSAAIYADFRLYLSLLLEKDLIPQDIKKQSLKKHYRVLFGIARRLGHYLDMTRYLLNYLAV